MTIMLNNVGLQFCKHFGRSGFLPRYISKYFQVWARFHWDDQGLGETFATITSSLWFVPAPSF